MAASKSGSVEVRLLRGYYQEEDVKTPAGELITVPRAKAEKLIESGVAELKNALGDAGEE